MKADREKRAKTPYLQHNEKNLQIAVQKNVFAPMESIDVTYTIKNTALETRIYFYSGLLFHTECCIKGNEIQPPCNEISPFSPTPSKFMMELIEPDQIFWDYTKIINHEHDMTLAGEYRIQMFHVDRNNFVKPQFLIKSADNNSQDNTNKADFFDEKYKAEWVKSNIITVKVDDSLIDISKVIPLQSPRVYSKPLHGVSISLVSDKRHYENYGPVCLRVSTKNVSHDSVSMIVDAKNVLDVYELVLLTPGRNRDFRKPAAKDKNDVQKVAYTLYGKKLLSEKSKTPKKTISVKPNEETAESVIVLNRIFDMSADGIYGLIVTRKIIDAAGKEQTILSEPFPIRIGQSSTQDEIDESRRQHILNGYDPDYPTWQSR
ncbi:MAG: hypothetical protein LBC74_00495, partial [Planctomycetaceae bacterium]|nr:hypothetical protein [Planctomycetaceae bacterium]